MLRERSLGTMRRVWEDPRGMGVRSATRRLGAVRPKDGEEGETSQEGGRRGTSDSQAHLLQALQLWRIRHWFDEEHQVGRQ